MASPPKLVNYDWRVSTKVASDSISRMNDASLQLSLQVCSNPTPYHPLSLSLTAKCVLLITPKH